MTKRFAVYKGLERPLVFKGFKGKFIYWGMAALLLGLIAGAITMALVSMWVGAMVLIGVIVGGLFYTAGRQKDGLYRKSRAQGIYVHRANLKKLRAYGTQKRI